jgi:hypothetical protein
MAALPTDDCRRPGVRTGQAAGSPWERISTRWRANQPGRSLAHLALAVQAPADIAPAVRRLLKAQFAEAIGGGDEATAKRLRERLDALLNGRRPDDRG